MVMSPRTVLSRISNRIVGGMEEFFYRWGKLVVCHPWLVVLVSLVLCGALSGGLLLWRQEKDQEKLWTPYGSPFIKQKAWIAKTFPRDRRFENLIAVGDDVLTAETVNYLLKIDKAIKNYTSESGFTYEDLCLRSPGPSPGDCQTLGLLTILRSNPALDQENLTDKGIKDTINLAIQYCRDNPSICSPGDVTSSFSGLQASNDSVLGATGSLNIWLLRDNSSEPADGGDPLAGDPDVMEWEIGFINAVIDHPPPGKPEGLTIYGLAERSYQDEIDYVVNSNLALLMVGFALLFVYISIVLGNFNWIEQRVLLSIAGMVVIGLALGASFGLCFYVGLSINDVCPIIPFLLLGIGVDDIFVIIQCLDNLDEEMEPKEKVAQAMKHAGVAITVTSFTDCAAFFIGASTSMPILRAFCIFAGTGVIFLYIFAISFFVACLVLDERRRAKQIGSRPGWQPAPWTRAKPGRRFFEWATPYLLSMPASILVILAALGLAAGGAYGLAMIESDYDSIWYMRHESYQFKYYNTLAERFSGQGERVEVYIGEVNYELPETVKTLEKMVAELTKNEYIRTDSVDFWHSAFLLTSRNTDETFLKRLGRFFMVNPEYLQDVRLNLSSSSLWDSLEQGAFTVLAGRAKFQHQALENTTIRNMAMASVKDSMEAISLPASQFGHPVPYTFMYVQWEANRIIYQQLIRNISLAFGVIALVTLLLIADPIVSLLVFICVALSVLEIIGGAYFMGLTVEIVTSIVLILSVGLALDYAAHIGVTYVMTRGETRKIKAQRSLASMGMAVAHGGISTLLAFVLVSMSNSYIYLTFFKMFLCVVSFGLFHALLLLPVLLNIIGSQNQPSDGKEVPPRMMENGQDNKTKL